MHLVYDLFKKLNFFHAKFFHLLNYLKFHGYIADLEFTKENQIFLKRLDILQIFILQSSLNLITINKNYILYHRFFTENQRYLYGIITYFQFLDIKEKLKQKICKIKVLFIKILLCFVQEKEAEAKKPERNFEMVANPCRAIPPQLKVIKMPQDCRYTPLKSVCYFIFVNHTQIINKVKYLFYKTSAFYKEKFREFKHFTVIHAYTFFYYMFSFD